MSYDPAKNAGNLEQGRPPFDKAAEFDFETAFIWIDNRKDYGEVRYSALGIIGKRLHALVFTETIHGIRIISLRKANQREVKRYEKARGI